jgi:hypothetical protein
MGLMVTGHVSVAAADDADGADANAAFRGSPPIAVAIYLERSPAAMPVTNTKAVRLGKVEEPKRSSSHGTGPQAQPVWRTRSRRAATAFDNACCCATAGRIGAELPTTKSQGPRRLIPSVTKIRR